MDIETFEDFYRNKFNITATGVKPDLGQFNVFPMNCATHKKPIRYSRKDYYKISFLHGHYAIHYADKSFEVQGTTLLFFNPQVPYTFEAIGERGDGYFCIFKASFFNEYLRGNLRDFPMYAPGGKPAYTLDEAVAQEIGAIFEKMLDNMQSDYRFKYDLMRNYVMEIMHYALKMQPAESQHGYIDANTRITAVFIELLERQFPIESIEQHLTLRSAKDFAAELNVHVNHLNRAVKHSTGRTTTHHITDRLVSEAKALLKHTDWNIAEVSYSLGFEEPAHFSNFFKKQTGLTPGIFRSN
ncbi:AraC family transcriptional regulator [Parapedobacter lycopersici]|uniref:helix-turn-helix domain-containing protein n=1 Tax=Parapedobacter lycopersici TaxID=1864939 RepID=UPI003341E0CA